MTLPFFRKRPDPRDTEIARLRHVLHLHDLNALRLKAESDKHRTERDEALETVKQLHWQLGTELGLEVQR